MTMEETRVYLEVIKTQGLWHKWRKCHSKVGAKRGQENMLLIRSGSRKNRLSRAENHVLKNITFIISAVRKSNYIRIGKYERGNENLVISRIEYIASATSHILKVCISLNTPTRKAFYSYCKYINYNQGCVSNHPRSSVSSESINRK